MSLVSVNTSIGLTPDALNSFAVFVISSTTDCGAGTWSVTIIIPVVPLPAYKLLTLHLVTPFIPLIADSIAASVHFPCVSFIF